MENSFELKECHKLGKALVGKMAQSGLLSEISVKGMKILSAPQEITGYEIVEEFRKPTIMVFIGGESIHEELLINIH